MVVARVTAIRRRRPGDPAVDVMLDSGESVRVHDRRIGEHRLSPGAELGRPGLDALRRAAAFDDAERRALRLLERRPRSAAELRARMASWGVDEVTAAGVLERLGELGQVDDRRLAAFVAESRRANGYGRFRTATDLARLAVDDAAAESALSRLPADDQSDAEQVVRRKFGEPPYDDRTARRAAGFLARRGFGPDAVAAAVGRPALG
jgi:regulatory protein